MKDNTLNISNEDLVIDAVAPIQTPMGIFSIHIFRYKNDDKEHIAIVRGNISGKDNVMVRIHSECVTSEVFHSLSCDCREQLHAAMTEIAHYDEGVILYLRQEGRGIGLANKIRAYALQAHNADTVDANRMLGLPDDARCYDIAADMLRKLNVHSVRLMTNNLLKIEELKRLGIDVRDRISLVVAPNDYSEKYLETKRVRMQHQLPSRKL